MKQNWAQRIQDIKENLIVFGTLTCILLPLRIAYVTYVNKDWFGSFGILTIASIILVVLVKKNKLGRYGQMFLRQVTKHQHGKRAYFFYIQAIILISIMAVTIYAISLGNTIYVQQKNEIISEHPEILDQKKMMNQTKNISFDKIVFAVILIPVLVVLKFRVMAILFSIVNDTFHGWILTMYTVALVEYVELLGIMLFYKFALKQKNPI